MKNILKVILKELPLTLFIVLLVLSTSGIGLFGYRFLSVQSNSMNPTFVKGDVIVVKKIKDTTHLEKDDIITYSFDLNNHKSINTHRIVAITKDGYITKGDYNLRNDEQVVKKNNVLYTYTNHKIPYVGNVLTFLFRPIGFTLFIFIPMLLMTLYRCYQLYLNYKAYQKEKNE